MRNSIKKKFLLTVLISFANGLPIEFCETSECLQAANQFLSLIDPTADPCVDFHQAACGGYQKSNLVINEAPILGTKNIQKGYKIKQILETFKKPKKESLNPIPIFNKKCLEFISNPAQKMWDFIKNELGGWPIFEEDWNEANFDLNRVLQYFPKADFIVFSLKLNSQRKRTKKMSFDSKQTFLKNKMIKQITADVYKTEIIRFQHFLEEETNPSTLERDISDMNNFAQDFNAESSSKAETRISWGEIQKLFNIDFQKLFPLFFSVEFDPDQTVIDDNYAHAADVFRKTPRRVLANLLIFAWFELVTDDFIENEKEFCNSIIYNQFFPVIDVVFIRDSYPNIKKNIEAMKEVINYIFEAYKDIFEKSEWLDEATRTALLLKLENMDSLIGYPEAYDDPNFTENYFREFIFTETDTFIPALINNYQSMSCFRNKKESYSIITESFSTINAYYTPTINFFVILAPLLNSIFFDSSYPDSFKFSSSGSIIGHEFGHAFDSNGMFFDEYGFDKTTWTEKSIKEFEKKTHCFIDQFNSFEFKFMKKIPNYGNKTLSENIADFLGLESAFMAYKKAKKQRKSILRLPGLNQYSNDEIFFYRAAQNYCSVDLKSIFNYKDLEYDVHAFTKFRAQAVMNSKHFQKTFNCKPKQKNCLVF